MRKSVIFIVMLAAFFSVGRLPAQQYYQDDCCNPCCWIREGSAAFSLGYRTDDFEWRFKDKGSNLLFDESLPFPTESTQSMLFADDPTVARALPGPCMFPLPDGFCGDCGFVNGFDDHKKTFKQKWEHQRLVNIGFRGKVDTNCCVYARLNADYGYICESDFRSRGGFCSGPEFFFEGGQDLGLTPRKRMHGKGHAWDVTAGVGHNFRLCCDQFQFAPVVGWSYHHQDLHTKKSKCQTACLFTEDFFDFGFGEDVIAIFDVLSTAEHKYCARWNGPWIGFDAVYQWCCNVSIYGTFEYHWARHHGDAKCDHFFGFLIGELVESTVEPEEDQAIELAFCSNTKLKNRICARGFYLEGGINYDINPCFFVGFDVKYYDWRKLNNGRVDIKNKLFFQAIDANVVDNVFFDFDDVLTRCEKVTGIRWESLRFEIKIGAKF